MSPLINFENKQSQKILNSLIKLNEKFYKQFGKINIVSVFLLELYKYLDSSAKSIINQSSLGEKISFPFVSFNYLKKNTNLNSNLERYLDIYLPKNYKLGKTINLYKLKFNKFVSFNISEQNKYYFNNKKFYKSKKIFFQKIFFKNKELQIKQIDQYLENFKKKNRIINKFYSFNFISYINLFICKKPELIINNNVQLLVGSNQNIFNRIMSANFILQNKKVISFAHAKYSTSIYEDPINDIGEYFFCNQYIESGNIKYNRKYLRKFFPIPKIKKNLKKIKIENLYKKNLKNYIYIPDSYNKFRRFGYFRSIDDYQYIDLQKKIINSKKNIYFKLHPKQRFNYKIFKAKKYIRGYLNFKKIYKVYIIDSISQSFFEIAKTNLKILYLHIPIRKLNNKILSMIKKRALVKNIDPKQIKKDEISNYIEEAENFKIKNHKITDYCM